MEGEEEDSNDPTALNNQSFWKKLIIFAAGAFMNFLTGLIIIVVLYAGAKAFYVPVITDFADGCPLQSESGLQVGDRLVSIDGERVYVYSDVSLLLGRNKTGVFDLKVKRDGQTVTLKDFPMERAEYTDQQGQTYTGFGLMFGAEEATVGSRLRYSWNNAVDFVRIVRLSLQMLVTGQAGMDDLSGPVGIVSTITQVGTASETNCRRGGEHPLLRRHAAVNLAVMNMLPIPALDGGKIFFLIIDEIAMKLFRKKIPEKYEMAVNTVGFVALMGFMLVVTFNDVFKLFG